MSESLFSNINGFNETAVQNIEESKELFLDLVYENDFTSSADDEYDEFKYIPFEEDIISV